MSHQVCVSVSDSWLANRGRYDVLKVWCSCSPPARKLVPTAALWPVCPPVLPPHPRQSPCPGIGCCGQSICRRCSPGASPGEPRHVCETPVVLTHGENRGEWSGYLRNMKSLILITKHLLQNPQYKQSIRMHTCTAARAIVSPTLVTPITRWHLFTLISFCFCM